MKSSSYIFLLLLGLLIALVASAQTTIHDPLNRLTSISYDNGIVITYTHDDNGNILTRAVTSPFTPPSITTPPGSQAIAAGQPVTFTVGVTGNPTPGYQWRKAGAVINGATSASYTIPAVATGDAGSFDVVVTNALGSATSAAVTLKLTQTVTFTGPANQPFTVSPITPSASASSGLTPTFSVVLGPATTSGTSLVLTGAGTVVVRASQSGNATYAAAANVDRSFTVSANFASWQQSYFTTSELVDSSKSGPSALRGQDGYTNLAKYALGLDPRVNASAGLPTISRQATDWSYTYTKPTDRTDIACGVEMSANLASWTTTGLTQELVSSAGGVETWRARYPLASAANIFFRLKVTRASDTSYSPPLGGLSYAVNSGSVNVPVTTSFTVPLLSSSSVTGAAVGRIGSASSTTLTVTGANWIAGALAATEVPYAVRITSGAAAGYTFSITANTADTLTILGGDPTQLGIVTGNSGDSFRLLAVDTLNTLFGTSTLLGGATAAQADTVILSSSVEISYYFNTTLNHWVRTTGPTTNRGNTPISLDSMISVTRKSGALTLRFMGIVPTTRFCQLVTNSGSTYTHTGFPVDVTLGALSLQTALSGWVSSANAANADTLAVSSSGTLTTYFFNGTNWQRTTGPTTNRDSITIPAGTPIQIFKRGSAAGFSLFLRNPPYTF